MHKHLHKQLHRLGLGEATPPLGETWSELLARISASYDDMDRERYVMNRSIEVASDEMQELNAEIAEERDKFASVFRFAPSGMAIADATGRLIDVNQAMAEMIGLSPGEAIGRNLTEFVERAEREVVSLLVREMAEGRTTTDHSRRQLISKSGESLVAEVRACPVRNAEHKVTMLLILVEDVTEKERLEVELRHSQKLESVGRLAAGIAHEINTPIQFVGDNVSFLSGAFEQILGLCDTYRELCEKAAAAGLSPEDIAQQRHGEETADLEYIRTNVPTSIASTLDGVARVAKIVQSMKAFAHPDRGERSNGDINGALRNTLTVATNELKYVARIETEYGDIPTVPCFLSDLNQVFLNLLVNAAHAIGDVVGTSGERGTIRVRTFQENGHVVVAISDTGTGIPLAVRGKVFDPFFTTKGVGKGTGQGLALAHSVVVEQHGGTISFETEVGKGTTFYVRLPIPPSSRQ